MNAASVKWLCGSTADVFLFVVYTDVISIDHILLFLKQMSPVLRAIY
jgi:hypothetical protein